LSTSVDSGGNWLSSELNSDYHKIRQMQGSLTSSLPCGVHAFYFSCLQFTSCHEVTCGIALLMFIRSVRRVPAVEKRYLVMIIRPLEHLIPTFIYLSCLNTILFLLSLPSSRRTGFEERGYTRIITIESKGTTAISFEDAIL
jgi:hypothetical protein